MDIDYYFLKNKNSCGAKTYILHNYIFLLAVYLLFLFFILVIIPKKFAIFGNKALYFV